MSASRIKANRTTRRKKNEGRKKINTLALSIIHKPSSEGFSKSDETFCLFVFTEN